MVLRDNKTNTLLLLAKHYNNRLFDARTRTHATTFPTMTIVFLKS